MPTILIAGYYGAGNTGDEAILSLLLAGFRRKRQGVDFVVISSNPEETARTHAVQSIHFNDIPALINATKLCDLFILGGGGLFHDYWEADEKHLLTQRHIALSFYGTLILLAKMFNKPVMLYAVGVGPLFYQSGIQLTGFCFENADQATVRDQQSLELIKQLGIAPDNVTLTADPAFLQETDSEAAKKIINGLFLTERPIVGVCVRNWDIGLSAEKWQLELAKALDLFAENYDVNILFIPFQISSADILVDDLVVAENIVSTMKHRDRGLVIDEIYSPELISGLIAECQILLGMRLHSLIFAATAHVPMVGIIYDPKVRYLLMRLDLFEYGIDINKLEGPALFDILGRLWKDKKKIHQSLIMQSEHLRILSQRNVEIALSLVDEKVDSTRRSAKLETYMKELLIQQSESRYYLENQLEDLKSSREALNEIVSEKEQAIDQLNANLHQKNLTIEQLSLQNQQLSSNLTEIQSSKAWTLMMFLRKLRYWLLPPGSWRERLVRTVWRFIKKFAHFIRHFSLASFRDRLLRAISSFGKIINHYFKQTQGLLTYGWEAYYFLRFKRNRKAIYSSNLKGLQTPNNPGLVSIVLPVYNGADFVCEALDCILAQTYPHFQLILVNDGSTDNSPEILNNYAVQDTRIDVIHQTNQGLPIALNNGFKHAKGAYLTWTSADNRWYPSFLERMVACLQRHPKWDAEYANLTIIDEAGNRLVDSFWYADYQEPKGSGLIYLPSNLCQLNVIAHNYIGAAFLYRNSVDYLIGDYSPFRFGIEDYDFWMRVNSLLTLRHTDFLEPVYVYRFHSKSLTSRDDELGITRSQEPLMVFEDARRDFFNLPMAWLIKTNGKAQSVSIERKISSRIKKIQHYLINPNEFDLSKLSRLWAPLVAVMITTNPSNAVPDPQWPENALKVLIHVGNKALPEAVDLSWDRCITTSKQHLARLPKPRQGWLRVADIATLFTSLDIMEKSRQTALIEKELFNPPPAKVKLSVIICTNQSSEELINSIQSVAEQTFPKKDYEVLIVNTNPKDRFIPELIERIRAEHFLAYPQNIQLIACPYQGLSNARNAGISEASGEVLCFLDDEAVAKEDWLKQVWRIFSENTQVGIVGGTVELDLPASKPDWLTPDLKEFWGFFQINYDEGTEVDDWCAFPYGANWTARRNALLEIGGFRARFGQQGDQVGWREQIIAALLMKRLGYKIMLAPQAKVLLKVNLGCLTLGQVRKTILDSERTWYQLQTDLYIPNQLSFQALMHRYQQTLSMRSEWEPIRTKYTLRAQRVTLSWLITDYFHRLFKKIKKC